MYEKEKIKGTLDVYFNFVRKEDIINKIDNLMGKLPFEELAEILKETKYITEAVETKDLEMARILCANGSVIPTSLLKIAIDNYDIDMLNFLLDAGININELVCDGEGDYEPIAYLAKKYDKKWYEIAEKMLRLGANPNAKIGDLTILEYYLKSAYNAFFYASNNLKFISLLVKNGATISGDYDKVLYYAAYKLDLTIFKTLIKDKNYNAICAIHGAIVGNNSDVLEYLLNIHTNLLNDSLDIAVYISACMNIFNTILKHNIPKHILNKKIVYLKQHKETNGWYEYHQMLKALKRAKRKAKY